MMTDDREFLTSNRSCSLFTYSTLNSLQIDSRPKIAAFKVGKHWRYKRSSLQSWIDEQEGKNIEHSAISPSLLP